MYFIAYKSILRRKSRTVLASLGVAMGIMLVIVMISFSQSSDAMMEDFRKSMSGDIHVTEKSEGMGGGFGGLDMSVGVLDKDIIRTIDRVTGVNGAAPRVYEFVKIEGVEIIMPGMEAMPDDFKEMMGGTYLVGIDPQSERNINSYMTNVVSGTMFRKGAYGVCLIGVELEEKTGKSVGDRIVVTFDKNENGVIDSGEKYDFDIVGVYDGDSDMRNSHVLISLKEAQKIKGFTSSQISMVAVDITQAEEEDAIRKMRVLLPDTNVGINREMMKTMDEFSEKMSFMFLLMLIFSGSIGFIGIINTMIMSVVERTKEIGVLMATGWHKKDVIKLIMIESVIISVIGTGCGIGLGVVAILGMGILFQGTEIILNAMLIASAALFGIVVGVGGGLYPAWRAAGMNPLEAFREG